MSLELGGKSAAIVFDDADVRRGHDAIPYSVFGNTGQDCCARSRMLVERAVYDEFVAGVRPSAPGRLRVGDPLDETTELGPDDLRGPARHAASSTWTSAAAEGAEVGVRR